MTTPTSPSLPVDYKDRRTGLILFGVFELLLGGFFLLMVPLALFGQIITAGQTGQELSWAQTLSSLAHMGMIAAAFIWLGIGSMLCRRWARAILLCVGWIGLVIGVLMCVSLPFLLPSMRATMEQASQAQGQDMPPAMLQVILMITVAVMVFFYVVIPGAMVLFYRSRHVKLTCEVRDPVERWTDRCPLQVLAPVLLFGGSVFVFLLMLPAYGRAFFLFGAIYTSTPAYLSWLVLAGLMTWLTVGFYRVDRRAWWTAVAVLVFFAANGMVSFSQIDLIDYYRAAGLPEAQIEMAGQAQFLQGTRMVWLMLPSTLVMAGYLVYIRRFFFTRPTETLHA